jgi:hypothetical protein
MMARRLLGALLAACIPFLTAPPGRAEIGALDNVPAATLLLPYFEVDLANPNGSTTLVSITNVGKHRRPTNLASALVVHVTLWTDLGVPTFAFDIYLTGYDAQSFNLRDVFDGNLPQTADDGADPTDTISPQGPLSQDINYPGSAPSCSGGPYPPLTAALVTALRNAHTGQASGRLGGLCGGANFGDNIARGYVTMDVVVQCAGSDTHPGSPGYFSDGGIARNNLQGNLLTGEFFLVDSAQNFAQGESLVHIEASETLTSGYTFYGRLVGGNAADRREPLPTVWAAPYGTGGPTSRGTDLLVWRDPLTPVAPFNCALVAPAPFPLGHTEILAFDTEENPTAIASGRAPIALAASRVSIGGPGLPVTPRAGWLRLNLNTTVSGSPLPAGVSQSYVMTLHDSQGRFSGGNAASHYDNARNPFAAP